MSNFALVLFIVFIVNVRAQASPNVELVSRVSTKTCSFANEEYQLANEDNTTFVFEISGNNSQYTYTKGLLGPQIKIETTADTTDNPCGLIDVHTNACEKREGVPHVCSCEEQSTGVGVFRLTFILTARTQYSNQIIYMDWDGSGGMITFANYSLPEVGDSCPAATTSPTDSADCGCDCGEPWVVALIVIGFAVVIAILLVLILYGKFLTSKLMVWQIKVLLGVGIGVGIALFGGQLSCSTVCGSCMEDWEKGMMGFGIFVASVMLASLISYLVIVVCKKGTHCQKTKTGTEERGEPLKNKETKETKDNGVNGDTKTGTSDTKTGTRGQGDSQHTDQDGQ